MNTKVRMIDVIGILCLRFNFTSLAIRVGYDAANFKGVAVSAGP